MHVEWLETEGPRASAEHWGNLDSPDPLCTEVHGGFFCTRDADHPMPHEAACGNPWSGTDIFLAARWDDDRSTD